MYWYLIVSTLMFFIGIYGFVTRKNMIAMLISLELILNAVEINFAVFNRYLYPQQMEGMFFTLFGIAITAAETAVALAIIINVYRAVGNVDVKNVNKMKN
jgi:NADH-quinone oxidoreductase subunit K